MAGRIVDLPDGQTPAQALAAVEAVAGEITRHWSEFTSPGGRAEGMPATGRDLAPVVLDLVTDVATLANMVTGLSRVVREAAGIPPA